MVDYLYMKHLRKCVGCGETKPREDMIKITKDYSTGKTIISPDSKTFGRSAYLCYNQNCIENAFKKNKIYRVLKTNSSLEKAELLKLVSNETTKG